MDSSFLWCNETEVPMAHGDPLLNDPRILSQLIKVERMDGKKFRFVNNNRCYFKEVQDEVQPHMRRMLTKWMMEVCEEQRAEEIIFPLATSYVDRFLSCVRIQKSHLQLLGAVCIFLASKLRQSRAITIDSLIYYTDYSVTAKDITTWELLVLSCLKWDMASVIASDFIDPLISRLDIDTEEELIRRHAHTFIALCATEYKFTSYSPSLLATSCLAVAITGLKWIPKSWKSDTELHKTLSQLTDINIKYIQSCVAEVEELIAMNIAQLQQAISKANSTSSSTLNCAQAANGCQIQSELASTDMQDVFF